MSDTASSRRENNRTLSALLMLVAGMLMLAYASVPLYRLFCQVTGFSGTTMRAAKAPDTILDQRVTVDFNTEVAGGIPLAFHPSEPKLTLRIGENRLTHYVAKNLGTKPLTVMATYNVSPQDMGAFLDKTQCFCFQNLTLAPGEQSDLPVAFFIDPAVAKNPYLKNIQRITLSYTFFEVTPKSNGNNSGAVRRE